MHIDSLFFDGDFLYQSEAIPWKPGFYDGAGGLILWPAGATIPGYVLADSVTYHQDESRWEIVAKGVYDSASTSWTVEIRRRLDTGHADDIAFVLGEDVSCSVGFTDSPNHNSPGPHFGSEQFVIEF
jgi:hypothetical protein